MSGRVARIPEIERLAKLMKSHGVASGVPSAIVDAILELGRRVETLEEQVAGLKKDAEALDRRTSHSIRLD
jgi:hypothetical protein